MKFLVDAQLPVRLADISNVELLTLIDERLPELDAALSSSAFVELRRTLLVIHSPRGE